MGYREGEGFAECSLEQQIFIGKSPAVQAEVIPGRAPYSVQTPAGLF
jgi:hypothetical protein